jgi:hypothetical protein
MAELDLTRLSKLVNESELVELIVKEHPFYIGSAGQEAGNGAAIMS